MIEYPDPPLLRSIVVEQDDGEPTVVLFAEGNVSMRLTLEQLRGVNDRVSALLRGRVWLEYGFVPRDTAVEVTTTNGGSARGRIVSDWSRGRDVVLELGGRCIQIEGDRVLTVTPEATGSWSA